MMVTVLIEEQDEEHTVSSARFQNGDLDGRHERGKAGTVSYIGAGEDFEFGPLQFDLKVTASDSRPG